jgi:hypothetical protein
MPLLDHFRPPLSEETPWESFHSFWAVEIAALLNRVLPRRYRAEVQTHLGTQVEADVAEWDRAPDADEGNGEGGTAVQVWAPPAPPLTLPVVFPDDFEVRIRDTREAHRLAAVVELASPRNLDRPESRSAFAAKSAAYLQRGIGLVMVDTITVRHFNLHNELIDLLRLGEAFRMPDETTLYAVAYRPTRQNDTNRVDAWPVPLAVGGPLPLLPLALRGARPIPLDLEMSYTEAVARARL